MQQSAITNIKQSVITTSSSSYTLIQRLLQFQNIFINMVHSEILSYTQQQQIKQALLKFQILRMGDKNQLFNQMISTLKKQLIQDKQQADPILKNYFIKILDLDYLPLLHINRYQLTKLSIFGFDIYIDPLQAILQILNRLQRTFYILQESMKDKSQPYKLIQNKTSWDILLSGWSNYYIYLHFHKLSLNIYMLKQYIQTAGTSLFKKDKEIIFTGVYNLFKKLTPKLISMQQLQFLQELAELNNTMYSFHGSFDYFLFYTCLTPQPQFIKVYQKINDLQKKCKNTNILTPLLFGVLNNYKSFTQFVNRANSVQYAHLLRVLLSGLIINFKIRILEYQQLLTLIGAIINKLNLLKGMKLQIITSQLTKQWRQAKDFFISAFKSGYNVGQIQTWNLCENDQVQPKIRSHLILGMLLLQNCKYNDFIKSLQKNELEDILSNQISELTSNTQNLNSLTNNWKKLSVYEGQFSQQKPLNIIRIINLLNILQTYSQRILYSICSYIIDLNCQDILIRKVLSQTSQTINSMITNINRKQSISNLKDILPKFHVKYPPKDTFQDIVPVYLHCYITKQAIGNLIQIISITQKDTISNYIKQLLTSLIQKYFSKPSHNAQTLRNFDKQYKVPYEIVHMNSQITSVFTSLTKSLTSSLQNRDLLSQILINLLRYCPYYAVSVLSLPISFQQNIQSFQSWLIKNQNPKCQLMLKQILIILQDFSQNKFQQQEHQTDETLNLPTNNTLDLKNYLHQCFYLSILDSILGTLSMSIVNQNWEKNQQSVDQIIKLVDLFVDIQGQFLSGASNESVLQKIWSNLLDLLSFILKSAQFSLIRTESCCKLYWKILKRFKYQSIIEWYQKMSLNIIFSTFNTEGLLNSESFKGITLISNTKNYMISKQIQKNNDSQNIKDLPLQKYNFAEIKQFLQNNYRSLKTINKDNQNSTSQLQNLRKHKQISFKNQPIVKFSALHGYNEKDSIPSLSENHLQLIYNQYKSNQNSQMSEFCLQLLKLNPLNHKNLWKMAKLNQKATFLSQLSFTRQNISEIFQILDLLEKSHQLNKQKQIDKNSNHKLIQQQLMQMLTLQLLSKNVNQLEILTSTFYFDSNKLEIFLNKKQIFWFLIVCNNSNWREFNESLSAYLKNQNFLSTLLQYKEFISITKSSSSDYEKKINEFAEILTKYSFYINKKIEFIKLLKASDSEKQNQIRRSTLLINIKLVLLKCQFEKILQRLAMVGKEIHNNSLSDKIFNNLFEFMHQLNGLCNYLSQGNIKLPSFSYKNCYITQNSEEKQFVFGRWLQEVQKVCEHEFGKSYWCQKQQFIVKNNLVDFLSQVSGSQDIMKRVLSREVSKQACHLSYIKLRQKLKDLIVIEDKILSIVINKQIQINNKILNQIYLLGYLLYYEHNKLNSTLDQNLLLLSPLLSKLIKRQMLPFQLIKQINSSAYHHLKLISMNTQQQSNKNTNQSLRSQSNQSKPQNKQISSQNISIKQNQQTTKTQNQSTIQSIYFIWGQKQLIQNGKVTKVTQNNKKLYIDLVTEQILTKNYLESNKAFAIGYLNAYNFERKLNIQKNVFQRK